METTKRSEGRSRTWRHVTFALLATLGAASAACDRESALGPQSPVEPPSPQPLGLVEVTITGLGTDQASAGAISAPDVAGLERMREHAVRSGDPSGVATYALELPANADAGGDGTIQLSPVTTGSFTVGERGVDGVRYLYATFRVRNAQADGTPYDTPRQNLTFLGAADAGTLEETAISSLLRFDGSQATVPATAIIPTGSVALPAGSDAIEPAASDVLQVLSEAELADIIAAAPAGVTTVFPYGFTVRNPSTPGSRALLANPAAGQFDGLVTFAFRVPLAATAAEDPYSITAVFLAVDDTETRVTESVEEQGTKSVQAAADAMPGSAVTLLGTSNTLVTGHGIRRICRVRTAGTNPAAPDATMIDAGAGCTAGAVALPTAVRVVDADATPGGDGTSWPTAFRYLQGALTCIRTDSGVGGACEGVNEIWVAEGVYFPDEGAGYTDNDNTAAFMLIDGVGLYGGFAGVEYSRDQRDGTAHLTALDGDIDGDGTTTGSAARIITVPGTGITTRSAVLDGFTIRNANANLGAGAIECIVVISTAECSPTLRNLVVGDNGSPSGAIVVVANNGAVAEPLLDRVVVTRNRGNDMVAGLLVHSSAGTANVLVIGSDFIANRGRGAGAALIRAMSGGTADATFQNVRFHSDTAMSTTGDVGFGAAVHLDGGSATFDNVEIWNTFGLAAIYSESGAVTLTNTTVALHEGLEGGIYRNGVGTLTIHNSIVYGNTPIDIDLFSGTATITHSLIGDGCPVGATCTNLVGGDPGFADMAGGDLRITGPSAVTDSGNNAMVASDVFDLDSDGDTSEPVPFDVGGRVRIVDWTSSGVPTVDMGAHERQ